MTEVMAVLLSCDDVVTGSLWSKMTTGLREVITGSGWLSCSKVFLCILKVVGRSPSTTDCAGNYTIRSLASSCFLRDSSSLSFSQMIKSNSLTCSKFFFHSSFMQFCPCRNSCLNFPESATLCCNFSFSLANFSIRSLANYQLLICD